MTDFNADEEDADLKDEIGIVSLYLCCFSLSLCLFGYYFIFGFIFDFCWCCFVIFVIFMRLLFSS